MWRRLLVLAIACAGCTAQGPVYESKSLADWTEALQTGDALRRCEAAAALGQMGRAASAAVPVLIKALDDDDPSVRAAAAVALGKTGATARSAIPALMSTRAKDDNELVRHSAARALESIKPTERNGPGLMLYISLAAGLAFLVGAGVWARRQFGQIWAKSLAENLKHQDAAVRLRSARRLALLGASARAAVPTLIDALRDKDSAVRIAADHALAKLGVETKTDIADLIVALCHPDPFVRARAMVLLGNLGRRAKDAVPALIAATQEKEPIVRVQAIEALGSIGSKAAMSCLLLAAKDTDYAVHRAATLALQKIGR